MGVPRKMRESHWGTYFIWPFRCRGFFGGSRMSSKMVLLHFPKGEPRGTGQREEEEEEEEEGKEEEEEEGEDEEEVKRKEE